jgi:hypothetical protein
MKFLQIEFGNIFQFKKSQNRNFEHTTNPLLRHYLEYRAGLIGLSLKIQTAIAIFAAVFLPQLQSILQAPFGQYSLAFSLLGIPAISLFVIKRLVYFSHTGWKKHHPTLDYSGTWCYVGQFGVAAKSSKLLSTDRQKDVEFLENTFQGKYEHGQIFFNQDVFGLQIKNAYGEIGGVRVSWNSFAADFSERDIAWAFIAKIFWPTTINLNPEFNGIESYNIIENDDKGRPTVMIGPLTGCVQEGNEFALEAKLIFWRKESFDGVPNQANGYLGYNP